MLSSTRSQPPLATIHSQSTLLQTQDAPATSAESKSQREFPTNFLDTTNITNYSAKSRDGIHPTKRDPPVRINSGSSVFSVESSLTSSVVDHYGTSTNNNEFIYVRDAIYAWLPAEILSSSAASGLEDGIRPGGSIQVKITLPPDWTDKTMILDGSSIKELEYNGVSCADSSIPIATKPSPRPKRQIYKYEKTNLSIDASTERRMNRKECKGVIRTIHFEDVPNGQLPIQNIERHPHQTTGMNLRSPSLTNARDMADLSHLHEAAILYNVKLRHGRMLPYTRVGDIMVAVNPFQWIDGLYSFDNQALYAQHFTWGPEKDIVREEEITGKQSIKNINKPSDRNGSYFSKLGLEPHIFETASLAYKGLVKNKQNQTILVTGESGAGKTESIKIVMTNLATMEQTKPSMEPLMEKATTGENSKEGSQQDVVIRRVLESNAVFEAFGNAKTFRNNNSSRFGRFTQLKFDVEDYLTESAVQTQQQKKNGRQTYLEVPNCGLTGSTASTYLLEKSRIVGHEAEERTFHIFYQLLAAPDNEKVRIWDGLAGTSNDSFTCVGHTNTTSIEGKSDEVAWTRTIDALKLFGFVGEPFYDLMSALCVVLQLGNLNFEYLSSSDTEEGCTIGPKEELDKLSTLMGIPCEDIKNAMTERSLRVNKIYEEEVIVKLNPTNAKDGCDALAKEIYSLIFGVLVCQINEYTSPQYIRGDAYQGKTHGTINLLDIFGFEKFDTNRFEQICINYANERLQQKYVFDNFTTTQEEYIAEGIYLYDFSLIDNSDAVNLFEGGPSTSQLGLIPLLNEECTRRNGTSNAFVHKLKGNHANSPRLLTDNLHERYEFGIKHFAGVVTYDAQKFLQSNADHLPNDLMNCASKSTNNLIGGGFSAIVAMTKRGLGNAPGRRSAATNRTVLSKFRSQLDAIISTIKSTQIRYIRCIKPNTDMLPRVTDHTLTMNQLESSGLVTAIIISRETFPNKLQYDVVWDRYQCLKMKNDAGLSPKNWTSSFQSKSGNSHSEGVVHSSVGKGIITLKTHVEELLKCVLLMAYTRSDGVKVPSYSCGRTKVYFRAGAVECLETDRLEYYSTHAIIIQAWFLCQAFRRKYRKLRHSAILVQARIRGKSCKSKYAKVHRALIYVQVKWRGTLARSIYLQIRDSIMALQGTFRMKVVRNNYLSMKSAAVIIQTWIRTLLHKHHQAMIKGKFELNKICLIKHAAVVVQKRRRGKISQFKYNDMRHAAIMIQKMKRGLNTCSEYAHACEAAIILQKVIRGKAARSHFLAVKYSGVIIQQTVRRFIQQVKYNYERQSIIRIQRVWQTSLYRLRIQKRQNTATLQSSSQVCAAENGFGQHSKLALGLQETFQNTGYAINAMELAKMRQKNAILREEMEELEEDKRGLIHHAHSLEIGVSMARLQSEQLLRANASLIDEISDLKQENVRLGKELVLVTEKGDADILSATQHFRQLISQRNSEICLLEERVRNRPMCSEVEISRLSDRMDHQREDHLMEVNALKAKLQKTQDSHHSYWEKLTDVLETSHSAREAEVEKLSSMLKNLEEEKESEIRKLKSDIMSIRASHFKQNRCMLPKVSWTDRSTKKKE